MNVKELARARNLLNTTLIEGDITKTGYPNKSFDVVLSIGVHEHLNPITFEEPRRIIKDNGLFICNVPAIEDNRPAKNDWIDEDSQWAWQLNATIWKQHLERFGFIATQIDRWLFVCVPKGDK